MVGKTAREHPQTEEEQLSEAAKAAFGWQGTCYGAFTKKVLLNELRETFTGKIKDDVDDVAQALVHTGEKFIFIIDEWDAVIRDEHSSTEIVNEYMAFMRSLFKGSDTMRFLSLAYLTGILPVKRVKGESALNEFVEYTMTSPSKLAKYVGFTEDEVRQLCVKHGMDFEQMKSWYGSYRLGNYKVYNPGSVHAAISRGVCSRYWNDTAVLKYSAVRAAAFKVLDVDEIEVNITSFSNDINEIKSIDEALTCLIHLGYLSYNPQTRIARIPNRDVLVTICSWLVW